VIPFSRVKSLADGVTVILGTDVTIVTEGGFGTDPNIDVANIVIAEVVTTLLKTCLI